VAQLGVERAASRGREIQQIPEGPDRVHVAWVLPRLARVVEQFRRVEMAYLPVAPGEHVERRELIALGCLRAIVTVVRVGRRRDQAQPPPAALVGERANPLDR